MQSERKRGRGIGRAARLVPQSLLVPRVVEQRALARRQRLLRLPRLPPRAPSARLVQLCPMHPMMTNWHRS